MSNNYNKNNPCPICNGKDYCGWVRSRNGILVGCHRIIDLEKDEKVDGIDGRKYYHLYTKNGTGVYEEEEQFLTARRTYKNSTGTFCRIHNGNNDILNKIKKDSWEKPPEYLDKVYRDFLKGMKLSESNRRELIKDGWTDELLEKSEFYSIENNMSERIQKLAKIYDLYGVPGFYIKENKWRARIYQGFVIPVYDMNGYIVRLQFKPYFAKKVKDIKYLSFTSFKSTPDNDVNLLEKGTRAYSRVSYVFTKGDSWNTIMVTEGGKKARAVNSLRKMPCVSLPGVTTYELFFYDIDELLRRGLKRIIIAFDADKKYNKNVKNAEKNFIKRLKTYNIEILLARWDIEDGKGIDDLMLKNKKPKLFKIK